MTRTIDGTEVTRNASEEEPAYLIAQKDGGLIAQKDGGRVLKPPAELEKT